MSRLQLLFVVVVVFGGTQAARAASMSIDVGNEAGRLEFDFMLAPPVLQADASTLETESIILAKLTVERSKFPFTAILAWMKSKARSTTKGATVSRI